MMQLFVRVAVLPALTQLLASRCASLRHQLVQSAWRLRHVILCGACPFAISTCMATVCRARTSS